MWLQTYMSPAFRMYANTNPVQVGPKYLKEQLVSVLEKCNICRSKFGHLDMLDKLTKLEDAPVQICPNSQLETETSGGLLGTINRYYCKVCGLGLAHCCAIFLCYLGCEI